VGVDSEPGLEGLINGVNANEGVFVQFLHLVSDDRINNDRVDDSNDVFEIVIVGKQRVARLSQEEEETRTEGESREEPV
jgi:hypothetical protein